MQLNSSHKYTHCCNIESLNIFDPELQPIIIKTMIKNKLKELLSELKKIGVQEILALEYQKGNNHKIFHSSV